MSIKQPKNKRPLGRTVFVEGTKLFYLWLILSPLVMQLIYDRLIFHPDKTNYDQSCLEPFKQIKAQLHADKEDVFFPLSDGKKLHGWFLKTPEARKVILVSHGNAGNIAHRLILVTALVASKNSVFIYDYEGFGKSEGEPTRANVIESGTCAYDFLIEKKHFEPEQIVAYGESVGTAVACQLSTHRKLSGLILQSGFPSLLKVAHDRLWFTWLFPDSWYSMVKPFDNLAVVSAPHPPLLVIHGKNDEVLPWQYSQILYDAAVASKKLAIIDELPHVLSRIDNMPYLHALQEFINTLP